MEAAGGRAPEAKVKEKLLVDTAGFSASLLFAQVLGVIKGLVVMRVLGSALYGVLMTLNFLTAWTPFAQAGAVFGMQREIPHARAQQDEDEAARLQDDCFSFYLLTTLALVIAVVLFAAFTWESKSFGEFPLVLSVGLLFFAGVILLQNLELFLDGRLRPDHRFDLIGQCNRLKAVVLTAVTLALVFTFSIFGVYIAMLATGLFAVGLLYFKSGYRLRFRLRWRGLTRLIGVGFPIMISWLFFTALQSVDRVMILAFLGIGSLGLYGLGLQMSLYLIALPHSLTHPLMPRVYEEAEKPPEERDLRRYLVKPSYLVSMVAAVAVGVLWLALPLLARLVGFQAGLPAARRLVWHVPFASLSFCGIFTFMGLRKTGRLLVLQGAAVILGVVLNLVFLNLDLGILGVALATTITFVVYGISASVFAFYLTEGHAGGLVEYATRLLLPPSFALVSAFGVHMLLKISGETFWLMLGKTALAVALFLALQVPVAFYLNRKTGVLSDCLQIIRAKVQSSSKGV